MEAGRLPPDPAGQNPLSMVELALRRPYTFVVGALVLLLLTPFVLLRTPTDIFPAINIPVVSIDYSLAPDAPYPRALEEVVYAYAW